MWGYKRSGGPVILDKVQVYLDIVRADGHLNQSQGEMRRNMEQICGVSRVTFRVVREALVVDVREIELFSGTLADGCQGFASADDSGAHAPGAWYAILLLAQGARHLRRRRHWKGTLTPLDGWASAFGEGGPAALIFEQTGVPGPWLDAVGGVEGSGPGTARHGGHRRRLLPLSFH